MSIEKYSCYEFEVSWGFLIGDGWQHKAYEYKIYTNGCKPYDDGIIESQEYFDTEQEARHVAMKHIDLLESGGE
jgi:hypothetical protein